MNTVYIVRTGHYVTSQCNGTMEPKWPFFGCNVRTTLSDYCRIPLARPEFETPRLFMRVRESVSVSDRRNINFEWTMDPASRIVIDMYDLTARHLSKEYTSYQEQSYVIAL